MSHVNPKRVPLNAQNQQQQQQYSGQQQQSHPSQSTTGHSVPQHSYQTNIPQKPFVSQSSNPLSSSENLQFYPSNFSGPSRHSTSPYQPPSYGSMLPPQEISWLAAFSATGLPDEPPLLEELEINLGHVQSKTIAVLNPFREIDKHIMEDADLIGPLLFCLLFGMFLLLSGKVHFGYIYGVALMGWLSIWSVMNLMSESGINLLRTASILGYCLLPIVFLSCISIALPLQYFVFVYIFIFRAGLGLVLGPLTVLWCTTSSSKMFVTALSMKDQRFLVAYPVGLFYFCFALMTIF